MTAASRSSDHQLQDVCPEVDGNMRGMMVIFFSNMLTKTRVKTIQWPIFIT